ncbi:hypothetical protein D3C71_1530020 [compost metagenome]
MPRFADTRLQIGIVRLIGESGLIVLKHHPADLTPVQLPVPSLPSVAAVQYHTVVPDSPARLRCGECDCDQVRTDRNLCLLPVFAGIIGVKDMTALANGDQSLTGPGQPGVGRMHGKLTLQRGCVEHIGKPACNHRTGKRHSHR